MGLSSFILTLLSASAASMRADVTITSGTFGGNIAITNPTVGNASIQIQGQNFSLSGTSILSPFGWASPNENLIVTNVTFHPTATDSLPAQPAFASGLQLVYNGTTYTDTGFGSADVIVFTLNFSGPAVTAANALIGDIFGNYSAAVGNVPFSMTGSVTVHSGSASGPVILSVPISGTGLYSANQRGNAVAGGPGGQPSGTVTYQFQPPSPTMFGLDTSTQGAWTGKYGADGYLIANGPTSYPASAGVNVAGATTYTWVGQTSDPRALQNSPGSSTGIASAYTQYPSNSFTININFIDGKTHRVALYVLDWDTFTRVETVTIRNAGTNAVLDSEVLSNFHNGQYATWDLQGNVIITVTPTPGTTPVVSGIFFDPVSAAAPQPSFTLSATPASIAAGSTGSSTVTVSPLNGFASPVTLAATGWPAGILGTFASNPTTANSGVGINVGSGVAPGTYSLTVTGTSGALSATTTIALTVTAAPSLTISAAPLTLAVESVGTATVTVTGAVSPVSLSAPGWPNGITASFPKTPFLTTGTFEVSVAGGAVAPGTYSLPLTASDGTHTASTTLALTVTAGTPLFTISASPVTIAAGSTGSSTVTATFSTSSSEPVTLAASGWPAGITGTGTSIVPPTKTAAFAISVGSGVAPGVYSLTLIGTASPVSYITAIALTVTGGSSSGSSATYTGLDSTTQGTWTGKYGGDGFLIANDSASSLPSYAATVGVTGASTFTWAAQTSDVRALQTSRGSSTGIASEYYGNTFSINIPLTDGATHKVAVYLLDFDTTSRAEGIVIMDAATKAVLDQESFSGFHNGQWAVWNIKGNVIMRLTTANSASNAVFSGIFFGPASGTPPPPSFTLSASSAGIVAGSSGSSTVTVNPLNGFASSVSLAATAWPAGITGTFATNPTAANSGVSISVASNVAPGTYSLTVTGTSGALNATTTIALTVAAAPSFSISAAPLTLAAESLGTETVTVTGSVLPVGLSAPGWPTGITASFGKTPFLNTGTFGISVAGGVATGTYSLPLIASNGTQTASTTLALTVTTGTNLFRISATAVTIAVGSSGSSTVTATGVSQPVTLATSGWPAGITGTTASTTPPTNTAPVTISVSAGVAPGVYSLTLIGTASPVSYITTIALTVTGGSSSGSSAIYTGLDSTTQGTWNGKYGGDGFLIANDAASSLPSYAANAGVTGASTYTWAALTSDVRALQSGKGLSSRIASEYYGNTFSVSIPLTDGGAHQVAVYLLDFDTTSRVEGIVIMDAATNAVLDQESFSAFHNGQWAVWNIKGNVIMKITTANNGSNAVFSGIFFGPASGTPVSYPLTAGLSVNVSQLNGSNEVVQADPSSSVVSSADTVTYLVKWGDGQTNSATGKAPFTHTYATPGTYTVTLTLSDPGGETSSASQNITTQTVHTSGYGEVVFGTNTPTAEIVGLTTTMIVPAKPPAAGTLFLWPGLQPNATSANFNPIGEGVLQPVLSWGNSCAPTTQPAAYSTWWISGQYVNTLSTDPIYKTQPCFSGPAISVNVGDSLLINMTLSGTVWTQTITDMQTTQSASFSYDLGGQQQGWLYFLIEEYYPAAPITPVQFNNTTFTFSNSTGASCFPNSIGVTDTVSAPQLKNNNTQCFVESITLRAQGIN